MKKIFLTAVVLAAALTGLWAQTPDGREIMRLVEDSTKSKSSAMDMTMLLVDVNGSSGERRLQILTFKDENDLIRTITVFKSPPSVENTRFLTVENKGRADDQWIYLPALKKIKRIASGEKEGNFMGSDFSYADMESRDLDDDIHTLLREENFSGTVCWVVQTVPKPDTDGTYAKTVSWIDKDKKIPLKVEYYKDSAKPASKILINENLQYIQGRWTIQKTTMTDLGSGHKTVLTVNQVKYDLTVNPAYFTTNYLQTGRTQ